MPSSPDPPHQVPHKRRRNGPDSYDDEGEDSDDPEGGDEESSARGVRYGHGAPLQKLWTALLTLSLLLQCSVRIF
ncbi:hypothetical protein NCC49_006357 [Naganishia albida]|nr:hypothetical protein NCC49_006357 [Naganishia albida]